jgi:hypothetical protein
MVKERCACITRKPELTTNRISTSLATRDLVLLQRTQDTHSARGTHKTLGIREVVVACAGMTAQKAGYIYDGDVETC